MLKSQQEPRGRAILGSGNVGCIHKKLTFHQIRPIRKKTGKNQQEKMQTKGVGFKKNHYFCGLNLLAFAAMHLPQT